MLTSCRAISCVCEAILSTQLHCDIFMPVGKPQGADPLYRRTYNNASVLICKILAFGNAAASVSGQQQLQWLHLLHTRIDGLLAEFSSTKVDSSGDILTFVSGTEEGGEEHAASLIGLARSLLQLCDGLRLPNEAPLRLQLSMHTGTVVSGLVGELNMKYGVYGETVTIAKYLQRFSGPGVVVASAETVRTLPDARTWQRLGGVKLPNDRMVETFTHSSFGGSLQRPHGISFGLDSELSGRRQEVIRPSPEAPKAGISARGRPMRRTRRRDVAALGSITLLALLGAVCLAIQGRIQGISGPEQTTCDRVAGEAGVLRPSQIIAAVLMWAGPLCFACLAPLQTYAYARDYMAVLLRCTLLVRPVAAVAVAMPGAIASIASALLEPYREHGFIPWEVLDYVAAPAAASSLRWDLGLPVMMLCFSAVLPVALKAHLWSGLAMVITLLAQDGTGFPSAGYLTVFLMLGVGLPALLQTLRASPGVL